MLAAVVADIVIDFRTGCVSFVPAVVVAGHTGSRCAVAVVAAAESMGLLGASVLVVVAIAVAGHKDSIAAPAVVAAG